MKQALLLVASMNVLLVLAQPDTSANPSLRPGYPTLAEDSKVLNPAFTIKGEDIRRFPTLSFLEAVNGCFPWIFSFQPNVNDFVYVVDGNLLADINAISLYDIEEVTFLRGGPESGNYPLAKRGCFFIRTRLGSTGEGFEFNSNFGLQLSKSGRPFEVNDPVSRYDSAATTGFFQNYQASYRGKLGRVRYYVSGNFINDINPETHLRQYRLQDTAVYGYKFRANFARLHAGASIPLSNALVLDIGGIAAMQKSKEIISNEFRTTNDIDRSTAKLPEYYYSFRSSLNWKISPAFSNTVGFSFSYDKEKTDLDGILQVNSGEFEYLLDDTSRVQRGLLENNISFHPQLTGGFHVRLGLTARYYFEKLRKGHTLFIFQNNQPTSAQLSFSRSRRRIITAVPYLNLDYKRIVSMYAGLQVIVKDLEVEGDLGIKSGSKRLPYGGIVFSFMNLLDRKKVLNRLDLGGHYTTRNSNRGDFYRLEPQKFPDQFFPASIYILSGPDDFCKDKIFSLQATAGFSEDRFLVGTEWSKANEERIFAVTIPSYPPTQIAVLGEVETKGLAFFAQAQVLKKENRSLHIRVNALKQDISSDVQNTAPRVYYPVSMGLQGSFSSGKFFGQVNALLGIDRKAATMFGVLPETDDFSLNHLLVGYKLSTGKTWLKELQVFGQGKNVITSRNRDSFYHWPRYAGIGMQAIF